MIPRTPVDERIVAHVWERQAFDGASLAALGLRVLFRGSPSDAGGPDYQDAMLITEEQTLISGDIEFHVHSSDWFRHGHHRDQRYNNVILHVVWHEEARAAARQDGALVPTLSLSPSANLLPSPAPSSLVAHPCVGAYARLSAESLTAAIETAARRRFEARTERLAADLTFTDADQVLYAALLEACGYASNRQAFRALADAAPYAWVISLPSEHRLTGLLSAAGLTDSPHVHTLASLQSSAWRLIRLRPSNHPARRLAGITALLNRHAPRMADSLAELTCSAQRSRDLRLALQVSGDAGGIGAGRADEMVVSVLLPFVAAYGHEQEAWNAFKGYPAPPSNRWTRHMLAMLGEAGHTLRVRSAIEHQGLHALYHNHCRAERSPGCPVCSVGQRLVLLEA